jgi:dTDP-4-amino-4,6-dideoxygalactose transaminase
LNAILRKLRRLRSYWFEAPWCVPPWGWREFRITAGCLLKGAVARGPAPERFASTVKGLLGRRFAIPVGRGRDALWLALRALEVQADDEIVLPSYICPSVLEAVLVSGARPVFADVDESLHVTVKSIEAVLSPKTRCVIVPHLFGNCAPIEEIEPMLRRRGIPLIDDAAQSFGARRAGRWTASFGEFGVVCGGPGKPLAVPYGAILVMDDEALYRAATRIPLPAENASAVFRRVLAFWFWRRFRRYTVVLEKIADHFFGDSTADLTAHTLSNLEAALLCEQVRRLERHRDLRQEAARRLLGMLAPLGWRNLSDLGPDAMTVKLILLLPESGPCMADILEAFAQAGIECQAGYAPCHHKAKSPASVPVTESIWERVLCVPVDTPLGDIRRFERLVGRWPLQPAMISHDASHAHSR